MGVGVKLQKGHNSVIMIGQHFVVKFFKAAEKQSFKEYVNYSRVCNLFPSLCPYFSIPHLLQIQFFSILISRKLAQSSNDVEKLNLATLLYRKFTETGIIRSGAKAADFEQLINGACIMSNIYDTEMANAILKDVNSYLQESNIPVGLRHGDFHPGNIFKDANGRPVLIDLDSIRENSIQSIDPVYYCVEVITSSIKGEWYDLLHQMNSDPRIEQQLTSLLQKFGINYSYQEILLFALDRIGFETSIGIVYSRKQLNPLIEYYNKNRYDRKNFA
uniref:phosphotransferase family protein n=1 Tax=Algoriphagus sp. TaxID=1872435 RepID=UPI004047F765